MGTPVRMLRWSFDALDHFVALLTEDQRTALLETTAALQLVPESISCEKVADAPAGIAGPMYWHRVSSELALIFVPIDQTVVVLNIISSSADCYLVGAWERYVRDGGTLDHEVVGYDALELPEGIRERSVERLQTARYARQSVEAAERLALACGVDLSTVHVSRPAHASTAKRPTVAPPAGLVPVEKLN